MYVLCVINLTMGLLKVQLQAPRLLVGLWGTCNLVVDLLGTHFPLDVHPVASPPRTESWLILLDERIMAISEWEVLLHTYHYSLKFINQVHPSDSAPSAPLPYSSPEMLPPRGILLSIFGCGELLSWRLWPSPGSPPILSQTMKTVWNWFFACIACV